VKLLVAGIGDISFNNINNGEICGNVLRDLAQSTDSCDIVIGNLEGPLTKFGKSVSGKCAIGGSPLGVKALTNAGIGAVCLANNHIMDYGREGLFETIKILESENIAYFGAGDSKEEGCAERYVEIKGKRIALLGKSSVVVSSPCYATGQSPGVAQFDLDETKKAIKDCKSRADFTVVVLHWGVEHYNYPTPNQRREARELIEAGADLIIGHHPHVLQGIERIEKGLVCYSLGNFLFDDITWSFVDKEGKKQEKVIRLTEENRKGGIVKVSLSREGVSSYEFIPTYIQHDGTVTIENTPERQKEFNRLCSRLHWPAYSFLWRLYSLSQEWKLRLKPMTIGRLKWANLKKVRPKHFKEFYDGIRRSGKITSEKSTNPYE
jgi:capsule synthesis protein PGA_cap